MNPLLGQIVGNLMGGQQGQQPAALASIFEQALGGQGGGLAALVSRFEAAGLGPHVQSWIGTGQNMPISGDQVGQVFSPEQIQNWAQQAGTTPERMRDVLAQALPHVVDHLTPAGQVPAQTPDLARTLEGLFGLAR